MKLRGRASVGWAVALTLGAACLPPTEADESPAREPAADPALHASPAPEPGGSDAAVVLVVLDGVRWQDVFVGADPHLASGPAPSAGALMPHLHALVAVGPAGETADRRLDEHDVAAERLAHCDESGWDWLDGYYWITTPKYEGITIGWFFETWMVIKDYDPAISINRGEDACDLDGKVLYGPLRWPDLPEGVFTTNSEIRLTDEEIEEYLRSRRADEPIPTTASSKKN